MKWLPFWPLEYRLRVYTCVRVHFLTDLIVLPGVYYIVHMSNCTQDSHINVEDTSHISIVTDRINGSCQAPLLKHTLLFLYRYRRMFLSYLRLFKWKIYKETVTQ